MSCMSLIPAILRRPRAKPHEGRAAHRDAHHGARRGAPDAPCAADAAVTDAAPLARFRDDPIGFVAHALPNAGKPYPKQVEMLGLAATKRKISVVGCN